MSIINGSTATHLDFQNQRYFVQGESKTFDNLVTFSRGSLATIVDSTGKITYAPNNLALYSEQFDNAAWTKQGVGVASAPTVTSNYALAPDGTITADRIQFALNGGTTSNDISQVTQSLTFLPITYLFSIYLKSNTSSNQTIILTIENSQVATVTVTPQWQRFYAIRTASGSASSFALRIRGTLTPDTADILTWGAQLEAVTYQTTPSDYRATTSAAYYGPRFNYDTTTLAPKGLLIEEARTNLCLYSQNTSVSGASNGWFNNNVSISATATTSPDGTNNGNSLTATGSSTYIFSSAISVTASTAYTASIWIRGVGGSIGKTAAVWFWYAGTATGTNAFTYVNLTSSWQRVSVTTTPTGSGSLYFRIDPEGVNTSVNGDIVYVWGAQVETGAFATSYIPTTTSSVTRNADVASMTGTNFSSWYNPNEGTFVTKADQSNFAASNQYIFSVNDGSTTNSMGFTNFSNVLYAYINNGGTSRTSNLGTVTQFVPFVSSLSYQTEVRGSANNLSVVASAAVSPPVVDRLQFFWSAITTLGTGHILYLKYYNRRLPDSVLQSLTA